MGNTLSITVDNTLKGGKIMNWPAPTFSEVRSVEEIIEASGLITRATLKRKTKGKIKISVLGAILEYLAKERIIYEGEKGISWILNEDPKFQKLLARTIVVR